MLPRCHQYYYLQMQLKAMDLFSLWARSQPILTSGFELPMRQLITRLPYLSALETYGKWKMIAIAIRGSLSLLNEILKRYSLQ